MNFGFAFVFGVSMASTAPVFAATLVIRVPPGRVDATRRRLARDFAVANVPGGAPSVAFEDEVDPTAAVKPALILRRVPLARTSHKIRAADLITALNFPFPYGISQVPKSKRPPTR